MKKIFKSILLLMTVTIGLGTLASCSDDDDSTMSRLFRPIISEDNIITGLDADTIPYIRFSWSNYASANQYVINVSSIDGKETYTQTVDTTVVTFNKLNYDKEYNVSIKSQNTNNGLESKDYTFSVNTADFPTELNTITTSNIIDTQVRVTWDTNSGETVYDSLKVYAIDKDSLVEAYHVTTTELESGSKILRNLKASTSYRVEAYKGATYKGKKTFKTAAAENYTGAVVDLRGLDPDESYKYLSSSSGSSYANAIDSLVTLYPNQDITIVLQGGVSYRLPTVTLPATTGKIKFVTGLTLNGNAEFAVSGNFATSDNIETGGLEFEKIFFTEAPDDGAPKTAANFGGKYLFNLGGNNAKIGNINISNCIIKYKRGICRLQGSTSVDSMVVDNCIMDSIGGYGIANADNAAAKFDVTILSNSTFSNCEKILVNTKGQNPSSVTVQNCTFVYCIADSKPLFDYSGKTISTFDVKNCLFGIWGAHQLAAVTNGINGWSGTTQPNCSDCYFTSDVTWVIDATTLAPKAELSGTTLKTTTQNTFKSPLTNDFTNISDELKTVKAGDSRWY